MLLAAAVLLPAGTARAAPPDVEALAQQVRNAAAQGSDQAMALVFGLIADRIESRHVQAYEGQDMSSLTGGDGPGKDGRLLARGQLAEVRALKRAAADFRHEIGPITTEGDDLVFPQTWHGTLADGRTLAFRSVLRFTLSGGQFTRFTITGDPDPGHWAPMYQAFKDGRFSLEN